MSLHCAKHVHSKRRMHAIVAPPAKPSRSPSNGVANEVAALRCERARRQAVPHLGSSGRATQQSRIEACERYLQDHSRSFESDLCVPKACRAPSGTAQDGIIGTQPRLERRALPIFQPSDRHDFVDAAQNSTREGVWDSHSTRLAELNLVSSSTGNLQSLGDVPDDGRRSPLRSADDPQQLEVGSRYGLGEDQSLASKPTGLRLRLKLRSQACDDGQRPRKTQLEAVRNPIGSQGSILEVRIRNNLQQILGDGPEARGVSKLLSNRPVSKTMARKATQLALFDSFMSGHELSYPATGTHLACWIDEISESRLRGTGLSIPAASLSEYLSGVRTSLVALGHPRLPVLSECFALREVYNAYRTWESFWSETSGKVTTIRIAVPASLIEAMMSIVLSRGDDPHLQDLAIVVLARLHGLRADSVQSIEREDLELTLSGWTVVVSVLKGHTREQARRYGARRFVASLNSSHAYSCTDFMKRWLDKREKDETILFDAGCNLDKSLKKLLDLMSVSPPAECVYSSHSIRSAALTESCLLGDSNMGVFIMQYNWVALSMPQIYFDHRLTLRPSVSLFASASMPMRT